MEFQNREGRNDSLKLEFKEYLKKEMTKKRKKKKKRQEANRHKLHNRTHLKLIPWRK